MDEIEYKLNTNISVLIVNAIDKLITTIKSKYKPAERQKFVLENEELKFLREKCSSDDYLVSLTACEGLLALVELGVLEIGHTMSTIVTLLPSAHNYSAMVSTIAGLLTLDLKSRLVAGQPYVCQFTLTSPKHPLVTVLENCPAAEDDVIAQLHALCHHHDYTISSNSGALLRPVFLQLARAGWLHAAGTLWALLGDLPHPHLLMDCLSCQQTHSPELAQRALSAFGAVAAAALPVGRLPRCAALLPFVARAGHAVLRGHSRDPRPCYALLSRCLATDGMTHHPVASLVLSLLADDLTYSSHLHLHDLFSKCLEIINTHECSSISLNTFAALTLQWLHTPSYLTTNALKVASKIIDLYQNNNKEDTILHTPNLKSNKTFETLLYSDAYLSVVFKLNQMWERIRDDPDKLRSWFDDIESVSSTLQLDFMSFLIGIMMEKSKGEWFEEFSLRAMAILIRLVDVKKEIAVQLLPILLYKLANDNSPKVKMECLKALPLMAKTKENVPAVVSILSRLKTSKGVPASFLIMLYTSLAETQVRCFPYLQEVLVDPNLGRPDDLKWETDIARAMAVKRICEIRASTHGLELVSVISSLLNKCTDKASSVAAATALAALARLWAAAAVAPGGAWRALEPRLGKDRRPTVQISICNLLSLIPSLRTQTPEYVKLLSSTANRLWSYVASGDTEVVAAACHALAKYRGDDYALKDLPEIYRKTVKLPPSYCKTPADAARNPEDVLDYIPCEVWPEVFRYTNQLCLPAVEQFVRRLIEREVKAYRSGVYQSEGREPNSAGYLPPSSVVRGLMECFRKQATSPTFDFPESAILSILNTLTFEYPKPLPPIDLCFLHEVFHRGALWKVGCVKLAARQAQTSGSARRFVDNYLQGVVMSGEESDIDLVFDILSILCRSMPPNSLRPVLEKCLGESYSIIANIKPKQPYDIEHIIKDYKKRRDLEKEQKVLEKEQKDLKKEHSDLDEKPRSLKKEDLSSKYKFIKQMEMIRESLESEKIHDANRTLLSQFVENYFNAVKDDNVAWPAYIVTCASLPTECLERMTSPSSWWEVTSAALRGACAVRAVRACDGGLAWLNEVVDACAAHVTEQEFSLRCVFALLKAVDPDAATTREWFTQLMARTQVAFKETDILSSKLYLCDVFATAVIAISGQWCLAPDVTSRGARFRLLPAAAAALGARAAYQSCSVQMLEWLVHTGVHLGPSDASLALSCRRSLLAARRDEHGLRLWKRLESHFGLLTASSDNST